MELFLIRRSIDARVSMRLPLQRRRCRLGNRVDSVFERLGIGTSRNPSERGLSI